MRRRVSPRSGCVVVAMWLLLMASVASAQDVTITGTIVDESKASLPGVTVTATAVATGRQFVDVTDARGDYRLVGLAAGVYKLEAQLGGFATHVLSDIELLVGQNATMSFPLKLATLEETLTVSSAAPLVDLTQARAAGNVDRRQMEELPIAGRNWQQLTAMVRGITANQISSRPGVSRDASFALNLDGQDITQTASNSGFGQTGISRDAIAEFQVITNLFDVTMGRSAGIQVQAITRAGTNQFDGSLFGFFRDDKLNGTDAFANRVLPYSNRQIGGTFGGPIARDRIHFFSSVEFEEEPNTVVYSVAPLNNQRFEQPAKREVQKYLGRADVQLNARHHLTIRTGYWDDESNNPGGHPTREVDRLYDSTYTTASLARAGDRLLHEFKVNYFRYHILVVPSAGVPSTPQYSFPGLSIGIPSNHPQKWIETFVTSRYDLTWNTGAHAFKIGMEGRVGGEEGWWYKGSRGNMQFRALPADIARRFADPLDSSQWDLTGLDSLGTRYTINYSNNFNYNTPRPMVAGWIGDTWRVHPRLTLNLGARYDVSWRDVTPPDVMPTTIIVNSGLTTGDFGLRNDIRDLDNVAPRVGFAWNVTGSNEFVIRGGSGIYYGVATANQPVDVQLWNGQRVIANTYTNDGQPGWVLDPTRGVTADDVLSGRVPLQPQSIYTIAHDFKLPHTWQSMIGFQKQLSPVLGIEADLVHYKGYHEDSQRDPNLFYDPATGLPKNPNVFGRPNPDYGVISLRESHGRSDYLALATGLNRRYSDRFQLGATYTLMFYKRDTGIGSAGYGATQVNPFDITVDWAKSSDFQRHTVRLNGVWNLPMGFTFSGFFSHGSPNPSQTTSTNVDPLALGTSRIRSDLSIIPRNNFWSDPFQKLDFRISKDFKLGPGVTLSGIAEVFNVYDYQRYSYTTLETSPNFGQPSAAASDPRTGQLAFRLAF
jgi:hypothetical protein